MDSNLMSCPTCGHAVSNAAGACAYCGAIIFKGERKEQTVDKIAAEETQSTEPAEMRPAAEMSDEADYTIPATEAGFVAAPLEKEHAETPDPETLRQSAVSKSDPGIALTEAVEPEAVSPYEQAPAGDYMLEDDEPTAEKTGSAGSAHQTAEEQAQAESGPEEVPVSPAPEVLDLAAEEPDESETPGAETIEMFEIQAFEDKAERSTDANGRPSSDRAVGAAQNDHKDDRQPAGAQGIAPEKNAGLISEALGDTILLELGDEVQTSAKGASDKVEGKTKMDTPKPARAGQAGSDAAAVEHKMWADALKIEKAAQDMAAAIAKQKEKLVEVDNLKDRQAEAAKIRVLKKQKAALAKAQGQKKQKLLLAKAAALKLKKAAGAKAPALKKQRDGQAGSETSKNENAAATALRQADTPTAVARSLEVNSKVQELLKEYEGQAIGINYDNSAEIKEALLVEANREYFSVFVKDKKLHYHYPLKTILTVIEGKDGVDTGNSNQPAKFKAVIKVYPLVLF
jgi:hypothetical protein